MFSPQVTDKETDYIMVATDRVWPEGASNNVKIAPKSLFQFGISRHHLQIWVSPMKVPGAEWQYASRLEDALKPRAPT